MPAVLTESVAIPINGGQRIEAPSSYPRGFAFAAKAPIFHWGCFVRNQYVIAAALAFSCSGILAAQAQSPASAQQPSSPQRQDASQKSPATITGCVYREQDVPGRAPNPAERAGILEDYILAEIPAAGTGTKGATGTAGSVQPQFGTMYKLEHADDEKLKALVGKRVEVTGHKDKEAGDSSRTPAATPPTSQADKAIGRDRVDLAEFEVTSIKEVSGTCPAKPTAR
jgi:hypothetical protein